MKKIDEYLGEKDLIDLSTLSSSSVQMKKVVCPMETLNSRRNPRHRKRMREKSSSR